jgi:hypothetical protein
MDIHSTLIPPPTAHKESQSCIKIINEHQQQLYENHEMKSVVFVTQRFSYILEKIKDRKEIKILDIGGASGYFAMSLNKYFSNKNCKVFLIDTKRYNTWIKYNHDITFIEGSANDLKRYFEEGAFDLIFANRVFHHFVRKSWKQSINGMFEIMNQINLLLRNDGYFCILDHFYNGFLYNQAASQIIYTLTSCTFSPIVKICNKLGAESSGVGVCFLSKKMWYNLFLKSGFEVEIINEGKDLRIKLYKNILLSIKSSVMNNVIILKKKKDEQVFYTE